MSDVLSDEGYTRECHVTGLESFLTFPAAIMVKSRASHPVRLEYLILCWPLKLHRQPPAWNITPQDFLTVSQPPSMWPAHSFIVTLLYCVQRLEGKDLM